LVFRVEEELGCVARDDDVPPESLARLVVETHGSEALAQRIPVRFVVQLDLDAEVLGHGEDASNAPEGEPTGSAPSDFSETRCSSAASPWATCWFTIGCSTRCPIAPTGPAILTSASQSIEVRAPLSCRVNDVFMSTSAPTPVPFARSAENSGSRSSSFS